MTFIIFYALKPKTISFRNKFLSMTLKIVGATIEVDAQSNKSLMYVCCSIKQMTNE